MEGNCGDIEKQMNDLASLTSSPNIQIMEIGFNAGHSAYCFLNSNPTATLVSFDIGQHDYLLHGKEFIDIKFPNRHTLNLGDSKTSLPLYINQTKNEGKKFDVIFIDGGHDQATVESDIRLCKFLAHKDTIVILDDTDYSQNAPDYTFYPTKTWEHYVKNNLIKELGRSQYSSGRGMSWGKYVM